MVGISLTLVIIAFAIFEIAGKSERNEEKKNKDRANDGYGFY